MQNKHKLNYIKKNYHIILSVRHLQVKTLIQKLYQPKECIVRIQPSGQRTPRDRPMANRYRARCGSIKVWEDKPLQTKSGSNSHDIKTKTKARTIKDTNDNPRRKRGSY